MHHLQLVQGSLACNRPALLSKDKFQQQDICCREAATRLSQNFPNVLELAAAAMTGHRSLKSLQLYYNPTPIEMAASLVA